MFRFDKCIYPDCNIYRVNGDVYCLHHSKKKKEIIDKSTELFNKSGIDMVDMSLYGAFYSSLKVEDKKIIGSTFSFATFEHCTFKNVTILNSFFDFALFNACTFIDCSIRYSVFSGASFILSSINDSTVIHDNFNGANLTESDFSGNDFYYSTFIMSRFIQVKMEDCNLKRTDFSSSLIQGISFKYSNPDEAQFRKEVEYTI